MIDFPKIKFTEDGTQLPFTEQEVDALVPLITRHYAPRRFALCGVVRDEDGKPIDVQIVAWGMDDDGSVSVIGRPDAYGQGMWGTFESAESAVSLLSLGGELRLAWVDAPTDVSRDDVA